MKCIIIFLLAAIVPAFLSGASAQEPKSEEEKRTELVLDWPAPSKGKPRLMLGGKIALPDGAVLKITLTRLEEQATSNHLVAVPAGDARTSSAVVERGRCVFFDPGDTHVEPGVYHAVVELLKDLQSPNQADLPRKTTPTQWESTFFMVSDDSLAPCSATLPQVQALVDKYLEFADHLERAIKECTTTEEWNSRFFPELQKEMAALQPKTDAGTRQFYPAALRMLGETLASVGLNLPHFRFSRGRFLDVQSPPKVRAQGGDLFSTGGLKKNLAFVKDIAGRELCLWIVKHRRRFGKMTPEMHAAVREHAERSGVKVFAARLEELSDETADTTQLEKDIRW